jgi:hypothetical protein
MTHPKLQVPNPKEIPRPKSQLELGIGGVGIWSLGFRWDLELGVSLGFGAWSLGFDTDLVVINA